MTSIGDQGEGCSFAFAADDEFLTTAEAAELTKMSQAWYERKRWERDGPPYIKRGRTVRYLRSELLAWWLAGKKK